MRLRCYSWRISSTVCMQVTEWSQQCSAGYTTISLSRHRNWFLDFSSLSDDGRYSIGTGSRLNRNHQKHLSPQTYHHHISRRHSCLFSMHAFLSKAARMHSALIVSYSLQKTANEFQRISVMFCHFNYIILENSRDFHVERGLICVDVRSYNSALTE